MSILECPYCGNTQLTKTQNGEFVYHCSCCNGDIDYTTNASIDYNDKERCYRAAYIHLKNERLKKALLIIEQLEFVYPDDKSIIELRNKYNSAYEEEKYNNKINDLKDRITSFEKDKSFWEPDNQYINEAKLKKALDLLEASVNYNIECPSFRLYMWRILNDVRYGRLMLYNTEPQSDQDLYNLFSMAAIVHENEMKLSREQDENDKFETKWRKRIEKKLNITLSIGIGIILLSIALFFLCSGSEARSFFIITGLIGLIVILFIVAYCQIQNSSQTLLKKLFIETYRNESIIKEKQNRIAKLKEACDEINKLYNKSVKQYMEITFTT